MCGARHCRERSWIRGLRAKASADGDADQRGLYLLSGGADFTSLGVQMSSGLYELPVNDATAHAMDRHRFDD
jgi:hypothetical protein